MTTVTGIKIQARAFVALAALGLPLIGAGSFAYASRPATAEGGKEVPCGVLTDFEGEIQVMDPTRTHLVEVAPKSVLPCGGWFLVKTGWARIHHRQGFDFTLAEDTFVEIFDRADQAGTGDDQLVLYKGKVFAEVLPGSGVLTVATANARFRQARGSALLQFNPTEEETQLVVTRESAELENKFEKNSSISVKVGEATSLNFKTQRVTPSTPQAVSVASLKEKLHQLPISNHQFKEIVTAATARKDRKFASSLLTKETATTRRPATTDATTISGNVRKYERFPNGAPDPRARERWVSKLVGGDPSGEKLMFPKGGRGPAAVGKGKRGDVIVEDPGAAIDQRKQRELDQERVRLIKELSDIRAD
ncbi:MAG: hypothetical protein AB7P04_13455 [Bacteriovoracia bacterium]